MQLGLKRNLKSFIMALLLYQIIPSEKEKALENIVGQGENAGKLRFLHYNHLLLQTLDI